jgi:hypothetical protein
MDPNAGRNGVEMNEVRMRAPVRQIVLTATLLAIGCDKTITTQSGVQSDGASGSGAWIDLLVPAAARRIGAAMPVEVDVALPGASASSASVNCVALAGGPGVLRPVFPASCGASGPTSTGDAGVSSEGTFSQPAETCLDLAPQGSSQTGRTIALYTPAGTEAVVTLVGGLFADSSCAGAPIASVAVVINLTPPATVKDAGAASNSADAGAQTDAGGQGTSDAGRPSDAASGGSPDGGTNGPATDGGTGRSDGSP